MGSLRTLFNVNSTLQRLVTLAPGTPNAAYDALRVAIEGINNDKEFAAERMKTIEFVPDYPTAPDMSNQVRAMLARDAGNAGLHQRLHPATCRRR